VPETQRKAHCAGGNTQGSIDVMTSLPRKPARSQVSTSSSGPRPPSLINELERRANERIEEIVENLRLLLTEQQELVSRRDALEEQADEGSIRERLAIQAHLGGHEVELRRLLTELDALTGRAN
jgi:hypothetical protein